MGEALLTQREAALKWTIRDWAASTPRDHSDRAAFLWGLDRAATMYVDGYWSVERFEAHADRLMAWLLEREAQA